MTFWNIATIPCEKTTKQDPVYIVYVIESAAYESAYGVICTSCFCQKSERARYELVRAFDKNNECI